MKRRLIVAFLLSLMPSLGWAQTQPATQPQQGTQAPAPDPTTLACVNDPNPDKRVAACAKVLAAHPNDPAFS